LLVSTSSAIGDHPHQAAAQLAVRTGFDKEWLKLQVRELKSLGLTISHHPGDELSPRGRAVLRRLTKKDNA
jgi:ribosomal protein S19E (S16A)